MDKTENEDLSVVNNYLLEEQRYWVNNVLAEYVKKFPNFAKDIAGKGKVLSHPFYMGLSSEYWKSDKWIMVVGREARGYGKICDGTAIYDFIDIAESDKEQTNAPKYSQDWTISYLRTQVYREDSYDRNKSPFWNLFRWLKLDGFEPCWNNVDKVYFANKGKLTYEAEEVLSKPYKKDGESDEKSLLQREIEIAKPNIVLFVTGQSYYKSMSCALCLDGDNPPLPTAQSCLVKLKKSINGIPMYWTDHPQNLTSKHFSKDDFINNIIKKLF